MQEGSLVGSMVAGTGVSGNSDNQLSGPTATYVDASSNIYVTDSSNARVMLWLMNSSTGILAAGTGAYGSTPSTFISVSGLAVDSLGNMYISDYINHRIMKWAPNATDGTLVAGTGVGGNSNQQLDLPYGLYLDESNSYLYIADTSNHRIQRYQLGNAMNGTTVAGGNGQGTGNQQLNTPFGVCVSKNTGAIYIADTFNHRIQYWIPGATSGVTIVGITGISGTSSTLLYNPPSVVLSQNETYLYVSEMGNNRVQRFMLI